MGHQWTTLHYYPGSPLDTQTGWSRYAWLQPTAQIRDSHRCKDLGKAEEIVEHLDSWQEDSAPQTSLLGTWVSWFQSWSSPGLFFSTSPLRSVEPRLEPEEIAISGSNQQALELSLSSEGQLVEVHL